MVGGFGSTGYARLAERVIVGFIISGSYFRNVIIRGPDLASVWYLSVTFFFFFAFVFFSFLLSLPIPGLFASRRGGCHLDPTIDS